MRTHTYTQAHMAAPTTNTRTYTHTFHLAYIPLRLYALGAGPHDRTWKEARTPWLHDHVVSKTFKLDLNMAGLETQTQRHAYAHAVVATYNLRERTHIRPGTHDCTCTHELRSDLSGLLGLLRMLQSLEMDTGTK